MKNYILLTLTLVASIGTTPVAYGMKRKADELGVQEIEQRIAPSQTRLLNQQLLAAVKSGNLVEVQVVIAQGPNLDVRDERGNTPLNIAVEQNCGDIVRALIVAGADFNGQYGSFRESLIRWAIRLGHFAVVKELVRRNAAGLDVINQSQESLLHRAARYGRPEIARLLILGGANINAKNSGDQTAFDLARSVADWDSPEFIQRKQRVVACLRGFSNLD